MIKANSSSQQAVNQTPAVVTPPSFPTHNPAQGNKSFLKNAPVAPVKNKPVGIVAPSPANQNAPVLPKFPDPTVPKTFVKANGTKTASDGKNIDDSNGKNNNSKPKKKSNWKMALGVIVLLIVVMGTGTGFYLTQQSQDLRQQADEGDPVECPLAEACPHPDGTLITCDDANVMDIVLCNEDERVESCGGNDYCCPTAGGAWTTDMTACTPIIPVSCNGACTDDAECSAAGNVCDPASNKCRLEANPNSEICEEEVVDPVSCGLTGTLTDGTTPSETTNMSYEITSTGGDLVTAVDFIIHGNFQGSGDWIKLSDDPTPKDGLFSGDTTYSAMVDLLVSSGHNRQQVIDEGIQFVAAVYGPQGYCAEWGKWSETDADCTPCFGAIELETTTNAVSCDSITGTLTDGTVVDEATEMSYEVTYSGNELVTEVDVVIYGDYGQLIDGAGWASAGIDPTPTDGIFSKNITYREMIDLLVIAGHDEQQLIDEGIVYYANINGPDGFCHANGTWNDTGEACNFNPLCTGTISIAASIEAVACNETCSTDEECQLTDTNYVCDTTTDTCRLNSNSTSTTCQASNDDNDDSSNDENDDDSSTTVGCNDICVTNSDCQNTDHICVTTADGSNRCRLTAYTSSESCVIESSGTGAGTTTTDTTTQPSLPAELPESGPEDWLNWLKAGLVTMGIGTALFLLL